MVPSPEYQSRIEQWLTLTAAVIPDKDLEHVRKRQMLEDILLDEDEE